MSTRVVVGMSGGVDSSVAAAVLKQQGYEVVGVSMRLWDDTPAADAEKAAAHLGIPLHVLDFRAEFEKAVIEPFISEYVNGRTPNPCIVCNQYLKFGAMLRAAEQLNAQYAATGHYAVVEREPQSQRYILKQAGASEKDQTYVLYHLTQAQLGRVLFPLGAFPDKAAVRQMAEALQLPAADKPDSQEICFIPDRDYAAFIVRRTGRQPDPGNFVDMDGKVLGRHRGILHYTVGQRKGLGIAFGKPMFVTGICAADNTVILGEKGQEFAKVLYADRLNFIPFDAPEGPFRVMAKVRYSARPAAAWACVVEGRLRVVFDTPQRAIAPGQAVVLYQPDSPIVIGGGTICESAAG